MSEDRAKGLTVRPSRKTKKNNAMNRVTSRIATAVLSIDSLMGGDLSARLANLKRIAEAGR